MRAAGYAAGQDHVPVRAMQYVPPSKGSAAAGAHSWPAPHPDELGATAGAQRRAFAAHVAGGTVADAFGLHVPPDGLEPPTTMCRLPAPQPPVASWVQVAAIG